MHTGNGTRHEPDTGTHPIARPLAYCPSCGSRRLDAVVEIERESVHFLCRDCARCWHVELGYVQRVAPSACLGCAQRERCTDVYAADHPEQLGPQPGVT